MIGIRWRYHGFLKEMLCSARARLGRTACVYGRRHYLVAPSVGLCPLSGRESGFRATVDDPRYFPKATGTVMVKCD
jgi:hypothetical protein